MSAWQQEALCAQVGMDPFFPAYNHPHAYDEARRICAECPVRTACLQAALEAEGDVQQSHRAGMYGGLTPGARWRLSRAAQVAA